MKNVSFLYILILGMFFMGCDDTSNIPGDNLFIDTTEEGSSTFVFEGYTDVSEGFNVFEAEGFDKPFYIKDKQFVGSAWSFISAASGPLSEMKEIPFDGSWENSIEITDKSNFWARYTSFTKYIFVKVRIAYIQDNNVGIEYIKAGSKDLDLGVNNNANLPIEGKAYVTNLCIPHLNAQNYYVEHTVTYDSKKILNYAYEWVDSKKHTAWVAYSYDDVTSQKKVNRTDAWNVDPELPEGMSTEEADYKSDGFDKGHICASDERAYSIEANEQTFYFTNMTPQMSSFNQGYWITVEEIIKKWARSGIYDNLYVTKGGTVNQLLINFTGTKAAADGKIPQTDSAGLTKHGLACPKYYFVALLAEKSGNYYSIGFIIEHRDDYGYTNSKPVPASVIKTHALSIDDLEQKTGLDFFCNLPDLIEASVESSYNVDEWTW